MVLSPCNSCDAPPDWKSSTFDGDIAVTAASFCNWQEQAVLMFPCCWFQHLPKIPKQCGIIIYVSSQFSEQLTYPLVNMQKLFIAWP